MAPNNKKQGFFILFVLACAFVLYAAVRVLSLNDEARIRQLMYAAVVAFEHEDLDRVRHFIADAYEDKDRRRKKDVLNVVNGIFKKFRDMKVVVRLKINANQPEPEAIVAYKCYFMVAKKEKKYYDIGKLKVKFIKDEGRWKIVSLEHSGSQEIMMTQGVV